LKTTSSEVLGRERAGKKIPPKEEKCGQTSSGKRGSRGPPKSTKSQKKASKGEGVELLQVMRGLWRSRETGGNQTPLLSEIKDHEGSEITVRTKSLC